MKFKSKTKYWVYCQSGNGSNTYITSTKTKKKAAALCERIMEATNTEAFVQVYRAVRG